MKVKLIGFLASLYPASAAVAHAQSLKVPYVEQARCIRSKCSSRSMPHGSSKFKGSTFNERAKVMTFCNAIF